MMKPHRWLVALCLSGCAFGLVATARAAEPELLPAEEAFRVTATMKDAKTVALDFQIADGYYMYRNRFRVEGIDGAKLGKAVLPAGKVKQDATFGRVETYRKSVRMLLPIASASKGGAGKQLRVRVTSQGCADAGVCYPPQKHDFALTADSRNTVMPLSAVAEAKGARQDALRDGSKGIADLVTKKP
jgi:thioredoxin:protein disulfide reductase